MVLPSWLYSLGYIASVNLSFATRLMGIMKVPKHCYEIQIMYVKVSEIELLIKQKVVFSTANKENRSYLEPLLDLCLDSSFAGPAEYFEVFSPHAQS